ncbi:uncharacterized protein K02A2.6-like [Wyeomyia smithii]|uniref:uncharacterized protein K02A2.6-like n=1 Tax=Wyeomyia smithii TaxID=174621 RepID=UPI002467F026|nr:uncharacterized protein K02A2.6-like [Wyeomyia smithii]
MCSFACGRVGHLRKNCRFQEYTCKKCHRKGHLQAACELQRNFFVSAELGVVNRATNYDNADEGQIDLQQNHISKCEPIKLHCLSIVENRKDWLKIEVKVQGKQMLMELDTGAGVCVISTSFYRAKFSQWRLEKSDLQLQLYSGHKMRVAGTITPIVEYNGKVRKILFAVVEEEGPPLLGKNFMKAFGLRLAMVNNIATGFEIQLATLLKKFESLFTSTLGRYQYETVKLELLDGAEPTFRKPRQVPYKFQQQVALELNKMEELGIITRVDSSRWGTPLVPVVKSDGSIRLCGDYKVTLNRYLKDVKHPLPTAEEIFAKLNGGTRFSKLDLSKAYNQFELDDRSKELCAISTNQGVYQMNRLPFGVKPASGIVQREIEKLFCGMEGVSNFLDDVIVAGSDDVEHIQRLEQVFHILEKAGLKLNKSKCEFFKTSVTFIGYVITKDGLKKTDERIRAIRDAPEPKTLTDVRAFAGLVNYYAKFVAGFADIMSPLYNFLRKNVKFEWTDKCSSAFQRVKDEICKDITLAHFNPDAELILTCDASNVGVSAVLSQIESGVERPVAFASRTLHPAEVNYSVIDREALAVVYGVNKFFLHLVGNIFMIQTDHKPLLSLFNPNKGIPAIAASRMRRWANFLSGFNYNIGYVKSQLNVADYPSRFPVESWKIWKEEDSYLNFINTGECGFISLNKLAQETEEDPHLTKVLKFLTGKKVQLTRSDPYAKYINELSVERNIIMRGHRVVVPMTLRQEVLAKLHRSHLGVVKSKSIARSNFWWPGLDLEIESFVKNCSSCLLHSTSPPKAELIPWKPPNKVWNRIHVDFAGPVKGFFYLIIMDALSKWVEVFPTKTCNAQFVLDKLSECIARFGIFDELVSDNGTQFIATEVRRFLSANGIRHSLTSPGHPATNGAAENMVKTFKSSLLKNLDEQNKSVCSIIANFVMGYRKAVHCSTGMSPALLMLGKDIKSSLESMNPRYTATDNVSSEEKTAQKIY